MMSVMMWLDVIVFADIGLALGLGLYFWFCVGFYLRLLVF